MKTLLACLLLLSATALPCASAASARQAASADPSEFAPFILRLKPGASSAETKRALGSPDAKLGADLWIYWDFGEPNPNRANPAYDTLVVAFAQDRVVAVKITDGRVVRQLLAEAKRQAAVASSQRR